MRTCAFCGLPYDPKRSTSWSLKLTFCTWTCERKANGATIENLLAVQKNEVIDIAERWLREHDYRVEIGLTIEAFGPLKDSKGRVA